jgi:hypothetical protein
MSSVAGDHQPIPAVSCTSINAHCDSLGAGESVVFPVVIDNAGKPSTNASNGSWRTDTLDRIFPWTMTPPNFIEASP